LAPLVFVAVSKINHRSLREKNVFNNIAHRTALKILPRNLIDAVHRLKNYSYKKHRERLINERNQQLVSSLLRKRCPILLELGAGGRQIDGWTSADVTEDSDLVVDLTQPIPFPDNTVNQIYASHLLEHFQYSELVKLLGECYRILINDGMLKVAVPDASIYLAAYFNGNDFDTEYYCRYKPGLNSNSRMDYVNYMAYMGGHHRYMFDKENLLLVLGTAGFKQIKLREFDPLLDLQERDYESIYAEGTK